VLPLDDRTIELFFAPPRPGTPHARRGYVYHPPVSHLPADASPQLGGRSFVITAEVTVGDHGAEGILYARGSHNVGHCFFLADGRVHFDYNALGHHTRASGPVELAPGAHTITARFARAGDGGTLTVAVDGTDRGTAAVPQVVRILGSTGTDIGRGPRTPTLDDIDGPFPFTGHLHRVSFELVSARSSADVRAQAEAELARE
jgi:arylsulfatase